MKSYEGSLKRRWYIDGKQVYDETKLLYTVRNKSIVAIMHSAKL